MNNDLISREALKEEFLKYKPYAVDFLSLIDNAPIVEERPQGKWDYEQVALYGVCSNCGATVISNLADIFLYEEIRKCPYNTNFCPNCGARMVKK